eukprot:scaffold7731_cov90-Isochrysis_galbana.AAC.3
MPIRSARQADAAFGRRAADGVGGGGVMPDALEELEGVWRSEGGRGQREAARLRGGSSKLTRASSSPGSSLRPLSGRSAPPTGGERDIGSQRSGRQGKPRKRTRTSASANSIASAGHHSPACCTQQEAKASMPSRCEMPIAATADGINLALKGKVAESSGSMGNIPPPKAVSLST